MQESTVWGYEKLLRKAKNWECTEPFIIQILSVLFDLFREKVSVEINLKTFYLTPF